VPEVDPEERIDALLRDLRSARSGLSSSEVRRRLLQVGENVLVRRGGRRWPRELLRQLTHPLALLLWMASALSFAVGNEAVAIAVLAEGDRTAADMRLLSGAVEVDGPSPRSPRNTRRNTFRAIGKQSSASS
jgi:hypothetical protein